MEPNELNNENVFDYSNSYKKLKAIARIQTYPIIFKAKELIDCIKYVKKADSEDGEGYYKCMDYKMKSIGKEFNCTCQFYQFAKKLNIPGLICEHILALKLQLKMWSYNVRKDKEKYEYD